MSDISRDFIVDETNSEHAIRIDTDEDKRIRIEESKEYNFKVESNEETVDVKIDEQSNRIPKFSLDDSTVINIIYDAPVYKGDYIVIPKTDEETILETNQKVMKDDVTIKKIPYFETHNDFGETIYIGSEI